MDIKVALKDGYLSGIRILLCKRPVKKKGTNTKFSQMTSCEEVLYYLKECRVATLDGDGVPCEALCK